MAFDSSSGSDLSPDERERLADFRGATSLADLRALTGADDDHDAYVAAKREWRDLRGRELAEGDTGPSPVSVPDWTAVATEAGANVQGMLGFPGTVVTVDGVDYHVHGVTHTDTPEERAFLRERVGAVLDRGGTVYCEQGIRRMYFEDVEEVCEMDDYRWAMARRRELDVESRLDPPPFTGVGEQLDSLTDQLRDAVFELIEGGGSGYEAQVRQTLGDLASDFLTSHASMATGEDFESFALAREVARDPTRLGELQRYYEAAFLPQPLEREWLRRHDPELELLTHARNERLADYVIYHNEGSTEVHLVVGAAHQPGVAYYLRQHRDGERTMDGFEPVP